MENACFIVFRHITSLSLEKCRKHSPAVNCKTFFFLFFGESKTKFSLVFVKITLTLNWFLFKLRSFLALRNWKFNNTQCLKNFPRHETNFQMSVSWTEFHDLKKDEFVFSKAFLIFSVALKIELLSSMKDLVVYLKARRSLQIFSVIFL